METTKKKYKVFKVFRKSGRKTILQRNLTKDQARIMVNSFPDSQKSMVCFTEQ